MTGRAPYELVEPSEELLVYLRPAAYLVEGRAFTVWQEFATESSFGRKMIRWKQASSGFLPCVAEFAGYPVHIEVFIHYLNGIPVCFFESTSLVVHHGAIRAWFDKYLPGVPQTDAANFYNQQREAERVRGISG